MSLWPHPMGSRRAQRARVAAYIVLPILVIGVLVMDSMGRKRLERDPFANFPAKAPAQQAPRSVAKAKTHAKEKAAAPVDSTELAEATARADWAKVETLLLGPQAESSREEMLRGLATRLDDKSRVMLNSGSRAKLLSMITEFLASPSTRVRARDLNHLKSARLIAAHIAASLVKTESQSEALQTDPEMFSLLDRLERKDETRPILLSAALAQGALQAKGFEYLKHMCNDLDLAVVKSCLTVAEAAAPSDQKQQFLEWVRNGAQGFHPDLKPLVARVLNDGE